MIMVSKPSPVSSTAVPADLSDSEPTTDSGLKAPPTDESEIKLDRVASEHAQVQAARKSGPLNLRIKMLLLFFFIPLALLIGASFLYLWQQDKLATLLTEQSTKVVNQMAEEKIADLSTAVAIQCRLYLLANPNLAEEDFMNDMGFKTLAVQKVGLTGYTALYELPDLDGIWRTWAHVNPKIVGIDMATLKGPMGRNFPGFWKIFSGVKGGQRSQGYYTWQDKDGQFREKFMVCTPVAGTPYVVAATTYLDEFHGPVQLMQNRADELTKKTRWIIWAILGATVVLIGLIVSIYSHRLTTKIKNLTDVAERISIGDLGIEIKAHSKDEIGELAEAISRMQESIRMSIERLRRRR
jgi:HAMP domain-containing protein